MLIKKCKLFLNVHSLYNVQITLNVFNYVFSITCISITVQHCGINNEKLGLLQRNRAMHSVVWKCAYAKSRIYSTLANARATKM